MFIASAWQQYFRYPNEGLGTTYERFILHQYFERIKDLHSIKSVLETPSFGMTGISGINSMWWAAQGIPVTVVDDNLKRLRLIEMVWKKIPLEVDLAFEKDFGSLSFEKECFDLGWNFAALWLVSNLERFLKELTRVTRKVIFICVPNRSNLLHLLRLGFQKNSDKSLHAHNINPVKIKEIMAKLKWQVEEQGYLDIPPWPDIAMNKEDLLCKIGLKWLANRLKNRKENYICILDYFNGRKKDMDKEIFRYAFLENSPRIFQKLWAHHQYLIFTPK